MNYRHAYHAGNFADVVKHALLIALLESLLGKDKPLSYVETHAGAGRYDLDSEAARRTGEAANGIVRLQACRGRSPLLDRYLDRVQACGPRGYPGSPWLAAGMLRETDAMHLCEWQDEEARDLRRLFSDDPRVHVHRRDGYAALKALLPPHPRRGLVLIDPPFEEQSDEFSRIQAALATALGRWPEGIHAVWYPIKLGRELQPFRRWLRACPARSVLDVQVLIQPDTVPQRLNGSGMAILHPPWRFEERIAAWLPLLARTLAADGETGHVRMTWLRQATDSD